MTDSYTNKKEDELWGNELEQKFYPYIAGGKGWDLKNFIRTLLQQQKTELIESVNKEVIGEDEIGYTNTVNTFRNSESAKQSIQNELRQEQRIKLSTLEGNI